MISIHAPAWGATDYLVVVTIEYIHFNPRSRVGCDGICPAGMPGNQNFNPRSRVGSDRR